MMKKRIISLLLTVAMLISAIPIIANADAVETEPSFKSVNLKLDGILGLNVKVDPGSVSDMNGYKVKFTVGEDTPWECTEPTQQDNLYVYTAKIPAHKLNKNVQVELLNAENETVDSSTWTLDSYLSKVVAYDGGLTTLSDALKLYATNAAAYAANSAGTAVTAVDQAALLDYKCNVETSGEIVPRAVLLLNDACTLRVQISADKWSEGYSLKIGGEAKNLEYNEEKGIYYYDIKDIRAQDWGKKYVVEIADSSSTLYKVNYAVMSYVYTVLGQPDAYADEIDLLKAMFLYFSGTTNYQNAERYNYSVTYNANYEGSEETKVDSATVTATSKNFTVGANTFQRPGYKFVGWNTKADGTGTSYAVGDTLPLGADGTLMNEDFNALPNGTAYENGAEAATNYWSVTDGVVTHNNPAKNGTATDISVWMLDTAVTADDYEITANLAVPKNNYSVGLVFADNQFFRIWNNGNGAFKWYAGYDVNNASSNFPGCGGVSIVLNSGDKVTVKVKVEGNQFSISANGTLLTTVTANKEQLTGKIGLYVRSPYNDDKACFDSIKVSAAKTTETLYAQWEEDVLFNMNLAELTTNPEGWRHINNGSYATQNDEHDTSAWAVSDGVMKCSITSNNQVLRLGTIDAENYEITVNVVMQSEIGGSIGLAFGENHYFRIWLNGSGYWRLYAGDTSNMYASAPQGGVINELSPVTGVKLKKGESATLKVRVEGSKFTIYVNDVAWASATASTNLTGWFGLFQRGNLGTGGFVDIRADEIVPAAG